MQHQPDGKVRTSATLQTRSWWKKERMTYLPVEWAVISDRSSRDPHEFRIEEIEAVRI